MAVIGYNEFDDIADVQAATAKIDALLQLPNGKTDSYRMEEKHPTLDLWFAGFDQELIDALEGKPQAEKDECYDAINVLTIDDLIALGYNVDPTS